MRQAAQHELAADGFASAALGSPPLKRKPLASASEP